MFAGPNGSGKSTLKSVLPQALLGVYLNPDEIEQEIRTQGFLDLTNYGVVTTTNEILPFFAGSSFLNSTGRDQQARSIGFADGRLTFTGASVDSYLASVIVDFLRQKLLSQKTSFTFETVMSHVSKVEILAQAQQAGYRTYLYFVATDDPEINISRVRNRVRQGGHAVPEDRIVSRYHRSLDFLREAIRHTNRAYIFDNSGDNQKHAWLAEVTDGSSLELKTSQIPAWFKRAILDRGTDHK